MTKITIRSLCFVFSIITVTCFSGFHFNAVASDSTTIFESLFDASVNPINKFFPVSPGIFRGARPGSEGLQFLKTLNINTVLDIENDSNAIADEEEQAATLGYHFIAVPLSGFFAPKDGDIQKILKIISDPKSYPVFVHCKHGEDRTGLTIGLFRFFYEKWTAEKAYQEMLDKNFHPALFPLDSYYRKQTGMKDFGMDSPMQLDPEL